MNILIYTIALIVLAVISIIGFFVMSKQSQALSNRKVIFTYLGVGVLISAFGFLGLTSVITTSFLYFILLQFIFLGIGFLVSFLWGKLSSEIIPGTKSMFSGVLFVLVNAILGMIGFALIFNYCKPNGLAPYYALSIVPFVLPQFIKTCLTLYIDIPTDIHKVWYFPLEEDEVDFDKIDTSTIYMMELEYTKSSADPRVMNTKLRAPLGMKFGDWYRAFIDNYNQKYDSDPIHFVNDDRSPQGWIFYTKPTLLGGSKYIDPDKSIAENGLNEKKAIIARRVGLIEDEQTN